MSSRYSPGNLAPDTLEGLFVGRDLLLDEILRKIGESAASAEKHYLLLVGPRGIGKTHLLALVAHRLRNDARLDEVRKRLCIAAFSEEEWGVASYLDFLLRVLRALSPECRHERFDADVAAIRGLFAKDPTEATSRAETVLTDAVGTRTLVLLCENLGDLFAAIGAEGQRRWRAFIQEHPFWTIVATSQGLFSEVRRHADPFFGFFTIRMLDPLDVDTAVELLHRKASMDGRDDLARFLRTPVGRARVQAIHHLAGGNHRAYIVLSDFLTRESLDQLAEPFLRMIDDLTPYYQERMRHLTSPMQRKLIDCLCKARSPLAVKHVAAACLALPQSVAKQLGELQKLGIVRGNPKGRETYYELSEPLMRLCFEVKENRTEYLPLFVDLLRRWFSASELTAQWGRIGAGGDATRLDRLHLAAALEAYRGDKEDHFLRALREEAARCQRVGDLDGLREAADRLVAERGIPEDFVLAIEARECESVEEAIAALRLVRELNASVAPGIRLVEAQLLGLLARWDEAAVAARAALSAEPTSPDAVLAATWAMFGQGQSTEALALLQSHEHWDGASPDWIRRIVAHLRAEQELDVRDRLTSLVTASAGADGDDWLQRAELLVDRGNYDAARDATARAAARMPGAAEARLLAVVVEAGRAGLPAALRSLAAALTELTPADLDGPLSRAVSALLRVEARERGPLGLARQAGAIAAALGDRAGPALGQGLIDLLREQGRQGDLRGIEWGEAAEVLSARLETLAECSLPLKMLSVACRVARTGDTVALMELPVEQRTLLEALLNTPDRARRPARAPRRRG